MVNNLRKKIIAKLQGNLPMDTIDPYGEIAKELNITKQELLSEIKKMKKAGVLRRMGAILKHRQAGFKANAMIAWIVPEQRVEEVGNTMAEFSEASHVYLRPTYPDWPYNLFTMVHASTTDQCEQIAEKMSRKTGIKDYELLYSTKEYKKTSMTYF